MPMWWCIVHETWQWPASSSTLGHMLETAQLLSVQSLPTKVMAAHAYIHIDTGQKLLDILALGNFFFAQCQQFLRVDRTARIDSDSPRHTLHPDACSFLILPFPSLARWTQLLVTVTYHCRICSLPFSSPSSPSFPVSPSPPSFPVSPPPPIPPSHSLFPPHIKCTI